MRRLYFGMMLIAPALAFVSCSDILGGSSASLQNMLVGTQRVTYTGESDIFALDYTTGTLVVEGDLSGKTVYYASVNTSDDDISASYVKLISSSNHRAAQEAGSALMEIPAQKNGDARKQSAHRHRYEWTPRVAESSSPSRRTIDSPASESGTPVTQITEYVVGQTTKQLWTIRGEDAAGADIYERRTATLYAYNDTCNVWVVSGDSFLNVDERESVARTIADAFASFYPFVRHIFGSESDEIYYSLAGSIWQTKPMNYLSDTGTKVNIVLYDLFTDGKSGSVLGFFSGMDYYPSDSDYRRITGSFGDIGSYSNEGKYFYVDSYFASTEPNMIISTLAHEFQHMILFGVKTMSGLSMDTNINEMLSMLCEDMMQQFFTESGWEISDVDSPRGRLLQFLTEYYDFGIRGYEETALAYANAYAFGAWLCRQYGGATLVKKMMSNEKVNNDCIVSAVNAVNGTDYDFKTLFGQFIKACYGKDGIYTFNRDARTDEKCTVGSATYRYPMTAINLWEAESIYDLINKQKSSSSAHATWRDYLDKRATTSEGKNLLDSEYEYLGPAVFKQGALYPYLPSAYGMLLSRKESSIPDNTTRYTLTFSTRSGETMPGMTTYVYIK